MSEVGLFLMFLAIAVIPFVIGGMSKIAELRDNPEPQQPLLPFKVTIEPYYQSTKKTVKLATEDNTVYNEALDMLISLGFTKTESKKMLNKVGKHSTVDGWVKATLESVEI
jgi:RuvA, C-terminal domain